MTLLSKSAMTLSAFAFVAVISIVPSVAQPGPGVDRWGPGMMMGPGMMGARGFGMMCDPRAAGMAEWRIERIERAVKPTDAQRGALNELKAASTKAAEGISAACSSDFPATAAARMAAMEKRLEAMLQAMKTVRPAFDSFYASLSDEQKRSLDQAGPRHWGWRGWRDR